jgi:hypothetical protein
MRRFTLLLLLLPSGCGSLIGLDDPPPLRETPALDGGLDASDGRALDTGVVDAAPADAVVADSAMDADADWAAAGTGNLLLYRSSDGAAVLTRIDGAGAASMPTALSLPPGFSALAGSGELLLGLNDVLFTATLFRVDRTKGTATELRKRAFAYPAQFALPLQDHRFLLQSTDYAHRNNLDVVHWDESASAFDLVSTGDAAPWSTGTTTWDGHVLLYYRGPALDTFCGWYTYSVSTERLIKITENVGDTLPIGPFWERVVAFGPSGLFAYRGPSPHGRVIPVFSAGFPAGVDAGGVADDASAPRDVVDLPAPIALLAGTKSEQLIVHQGDALVKGTLAPKGKDRAFVAAHRYDTGVLAKAFTSMVFFGDP